jgi:hypothetical protein
MRIAVFFPGKEQPSAQFRGADGDESTTKTIRARAGSGVHQVQATGFRE